MPKVYNIIDSVKGGCGKTTFSIMLAEYLSRKLEQDKVCLFDMDFMGTGMWNLFYSDHTKKEKGMEQPEKVSEEERLKEFKKDNIFVNDMIRGFRISKEHYIVEIKVSQRTFYVAFGNPDYEAKKEYMLAVKNNYSMAMKYGMLRSGLRDMFSEEKIAGQVKGRVGSVVLDMAPCNDNYSEAIKDIIFDREENGIANKDNIINYFLLLGIDSSQVYAAKSYLKNFIGTSDKLPNNLFIIFNDVSCCLEGDNQKAYNMRKELFDDIKGSISREKINKVSIYFLSLHEFTQYKQVVSEMCPLTYENCKGIFMDIPFAYGATLDDTEMKVLKKAKEQERVLGWITGK